MLRIPCPWCGPRDYNEFRYGGDADKLRPPHGRTAAEGADLKAWHDHVFLFDNPKGPHKEYWQHVQGCRGGGVYFKADSSYSYVGSRWNDITSWVDCYCRRR